MESFKARGLPQTILIILDMEFGRAVWGCDTDTLFETIRKRFAHYGYRLPKLVFWNLDSRTNVIPVRENELNPFACLKKMMEGERYGKVEECLRINRLASV